MANETHTPWITKEVIVPVIAALIVSMIIGGFTSYVQVSIATATIEQRLSRVEQIQQARLSDSETLIRLEERISTLLIQLDKFEKRLERQQR